MKRIVLRILIFGGTGFIGNYLTKNLQALGHSVTTAGINKRNDIIVDLSKEKVDLQSEYDLIIQTSSIVHNPKHSSSIQSNLICKDLWITKNAISSIQGVNFKKFIYLSSIAIYGLESGIEIDINQKINPRTGYGISKMLSERLITRKLDVDKFLILRLPLVHGQNPKGNILKAKIALESGRLFLFKGNDAKKSILNLEDLSYWISENGIYLEGVHQLKSYDVMFNEFIESLSEKKPIYLPNIFLKLLLKVSSLFFLKRINHLVSKVSATLTIKNSY